LFSEPGSNRITAKYHRRLFEHYLQHVLDYDKPRHPLWGQLNELYEASTGSFIDGYALSLAVAVEGLVQREFPGLGGLTPQQKHQVKAAQEHMKLWNGDVKLKQRIEGAISQLHYSRAGDKLRALVNSGAISEEMNTAWRKLRNALAHGSSPKGGRFVELLYRVKVLFYHLIFHAIGYKGPYMDYGSLGWPVKWYPNQRKKMGRVGRAG
jgi:hypothetical protein